MLWIIIAIIISYLIGSIPTAYIAGRLLKGLDIRKHGSGNVGATNALRVLGKKAGICVLLIDVLKGALPVIFIGDFVLAKTPLLPQDALRIILGAGCIFGHTWTIFLNFKGGKGVATSLGVLVGLSFKICGLGKIIGLVILIWLIIFLLLRIVSFASIIACICFPSLVIVYRQSNVLIIFSCAIALFVIIRHRSNLKRILQGKEPRLKFK